MTEVWIVSLGIEAQIQSGTLIKQPGQRFLARSRFPKDRPPGCSSVLAQGKLPAVKKSEKSLADETVGRMGSSMIRSSDFTTELCV